TDATTTPACTPSLHDALPIFDEDEALVADATADPELRDLAREEVPALRRRAQALADEILDALLAQEGDGQRSAIVEIRAGTGGRSEEHTSELQSRENLVCRLL